MFKNITKLLKIAAFLCLIGFFSLTREINEKSFESGVTQKIESYKIGEISPWLEYNKQTINDQKPNESFKINLYSWSWILLISSVIFFYLSYSNNRLLEKQKNSSRTL